VGAALEKAKRPKKKKKRKKRKEKVRKPLTIGSHFHYTQ